MAKQKFDLDAVLDGKREESAEEPQDTGGDDTPDLAKELENLKKDLRGKDRKINQLQQQLNDTDGSKQVVDLREQIGELRAIRADLLAKQEAFNWALEKNIPVNLALGNSHRLEELQSEIEPLYDSIRDGVLTDMKGNRERSAHTPQTGGVRPESAPGTYPVSGLTLDHIGRMSGTELNRIPSRILEKLQGGN